MFETTSEKAEAAERETAPLAQNGDRVHNTSSLKQVPLLI
jgi:hypothetical protein